MKIFGAFDALFKGVLYLKALKVAVCGTQCASEQLAADHGWLRVCSTRQAAVA